MKDERECVPGYHVNWLVSKNEVVVCNKYEKYSEVLLSFIDDKEVEVSCLGLEVARNERGECEGISKEEVRSALRLRKMKWVKATGFNRIFAVSYGR